MADLVFVSLGDGNVLCANNINAVMPLKSAQSKRLLKSAKDSNQFYDWTGARKLKTLLFLSNGIVVGSFFSPTTIFRRLERATNHNVKDDEEEYEE